MTRAQQIDQLMAQYAAKRRRAQAERQGRVERARELDPAIALLQDGMARRFSQATRQMLGNRERSAQIAARLREQTLADQEAVRQRLKALGLPPDYLDLHYECPLCQDTGFAGEDRTRYCACFEKALGQARWSSRVRGEHSFERYNPDIFPTPEQRALTGRARAICQQYADAFPNAPKPGLVLMGESGLGKSFLLDAVACRVQERGYPALRLTAFRMLEAMRAYHMGENGEDAPFQEMLSCPLLLLDDLGTEPVLRNITIEYLFLLLNEREGMATVIATNLTPSQLMTRYGERVCSRLLDKRQNEVILLKGQDLRLRGKT